MDSNQNEELTSELKAKIMSLEEKNVRLMEVKNTFFILIKFKLLIINYFCNS